MLASQIKKQCSCAMYLNGKDNLYYFSSGAAELSETGTDDSDGLRRRYRAGPRNGTSDTGRSQPILLSLQKKKKTLTRIMLLVNFFQQESRFDIIAHHFRTLMSL